jgi:hypothetical protein
MTALVSPAVSNVVGTTGANTVTSGTNVSAGSTLILVVQVFGPGSTSPGTVVDTKTGTWTALGNVASGTQFVLWQCTNPQAGVEHAVTWAPSAADLYGSIAFLMEWSGGPFTLYTGQADSANSVTTLLNSPTAGLPTTGNLVITTAADGTGSSALALTNNTFGFTAVATGPTSNVLSYLVETSADTSNFIRTSWSITPADLADSALFTLIPTGGTAYTVTFNANGGTGTMASESASGTTALTANAFTRTGYTFTGWNTVAGGSGTAYANGANFPFTANTTLYAQWVPTGSWGVMVLMLENQQKSNIVGSSNAPHINALMSAYPTATNYFGDSHPSLPNYLAMVTGQHALVSDDNPPSSHAGLGGGATPNLFAQLDTAGIPWGAYFESLAGSPLTDEGSADSDGNDLYLVHHNPVAYVGTTTQINKSTAYTQAALTSFLNSTPHNTFVWVTPNVMDDMHDPVGTSANDNASVQAGDTWVNNFVTAVQGTAWYAAGGVILICWDEAYDTTGDEVAGGFGSPAVNGGPVACLAISTNLEGHADFTSDITHIGVLNSIEEFYGLPQLGGSGYGDISSLLEYTGGGTTYPSGIAPPPIPSGWELAFFDDFLGTTLDLANWSVWDGPPGGTDGWWLPSHVKVLNDSILHLQAYQDAAGLAADSNYTGAGSPTVTGGTKWVSGGVGWASGNEFPPNLIINVAMKQSPYAGLAAIAILIGANNWPPEIDFVECSSDTTTLNGFSATAHWGSGNSQVQYGSPSHDMTQWQMWGVIWTPTTISYTYNNVVWKSFANPDSNYADINSLVQNMTMGLQYQTGDGGSVSNDPSVTAAAPMEMQVDWIQILQPGTSETLTEVFAASLTLSETERVTHESTAETLHATLAFSETDTREANTEALVLSFGLHETDIAKAAITEALNATLVLGESVSEVIYQVSFNPNGGLGGMANQSGAVPTALETNEFTLAGYTFTGWNTVADGSGTAYAPGATYSFTSNAVLYAQWSANTYTVAFSANAGIGSTAPVSGTYGTETTLTPNSFTLINANFNGWNTALDGSGDAYADGASFTFLSSIILYAQWALTATPSTVSQTSLDWWNQMGPWRDADLASGLAGDGYPLLTLIDAIGSQYAVTEAYTRDNSTHIGWSQLLDVNVCPAFALPWLAQFAGVVIPVGATESQMRALIVGKANSKRGTPASLISVLQQFLTGTQLISLYERDPDPYSFIIVAQSSQISGGAGGATAAAALAALIAAKPAGLIMSFIVQSGLTWGEMVDYPATTAGRWTDQIDTWASLADDIPVS